ncbi:GNAT family N-acetyltransferase [Streptomyces sp. NPDC058008]|uniref:GNAT family N-acetyltransferase n=1 Tax=Streptomyces sp. NPDC058008 TaxID=3346303 RepID=UPI0036E5F3DC
MNGRPVNGRPVNGRPVNGRPVNGRPVNGRPVNGRPVSGRPGPDGTRAGGTDPDGWKADGPAIGGVAFHGRPDIAGQVTIGYGLIHSARGQGFASEALRALLAFARSQGVLSVKGDADLDNIGSHHVMASAGMRLVAVDARLKHFRIGWGSTTSAGRRPYSRARPTDPDVPG